jgi:cold shock CspA family protein
VNGRIEKIVSDKGFGFIETDETDASVFFHATGVRDYEFDNLRKGDSVVFDLTRTPKGLRAENVVRV